jgi:hypothetical protein
MVAEWRRNAASAENIAAMMHVNKAGESKILKDVLTTDLVASKSSTRNFSRLLQPPCAKLKPQRTRCVTVELSTRFTEDLIIEGEIPRVID